MFSKIMDNTNVLIALYLNNFPKFQINMSFRVDANCCNKYVKIWSRAVVHGFKVSSL